MKFLPSTILNKSTNQIYVLNELNPEAKEDVLYKLHLQAIKACEDVPTEDFFIKHPNYIDFWSMIGGHYAG